LAEGYEVYPLSFDYGQRNRKELESAKQVVKYFKLKEHKIVKIGMWEEAL